MRNSNKPKKTKGLAGGIIAFGLVFAGYSSLFHPHSLWGYILAFALSGLVGAIVKVMGEGLDLSVKEPVPQSLKNMAEETGNPEVDALLTRGREMITQIRAENKLIVDTELTEKLNRLENQCAEIFRTVYEKPVKAPQIRKFMDYYLPTTLKMVTAYRTLGERNQKGHDTKAAQKRISEALDVVLTGCQKLLDKLYHDDVLDITTDIDVLEQMLKRDGLTQSDLQQAAEQARQAAMIDRRVSQVTAERTAQPVGVQHTQVTDGVDPSQWQPGKKTDVERQVQSIQQSAQQHTPQAPVLKASFYSKEGQATAQAVEKSE